MAHTPGPWNIQPDSDLFAKIGSNGNGGVYVAKVQGPQTVANARLIAAAPDLLEALEAMSALGMSGMQQLEAFHKARAAIRAARGSL